MAAAAVKTPTIRELEARVAKLEGLFAKPLPSPSHTWDGTFRVFPPTLQDEHIAYIYGYTVNTVRKMAQRRDPKIPTPSTTHPWGWNREDVRRHYERRVT